MPVPFKKSRVEFDQQAFNDYVARHKERKAFEAFCAPLKESARACPFCDLKPGPNAVTIVCREMDSSGTTGVYVRCGGCRCRGPEVESYVVLMTPHQNNAAAREAMNRWNGVFDHTFGTPDNPVPESPEPPKSAE